MDFTIGAVAVGLPLFQGSRIAPDSPRPRRPKTRNNGARLGRGNRAMGNLKISRKEEPWGRSGQELREIQEDFRKICISRSIHNIEIDG